MLSAMEINLIFTKTLTYDIDIDVTVIEFLQKFLTYHPYIIVHHNTSIVTHGFLKQSSSTLLLKVWRVFENFSRKYP